MPTICTTRRVLNTRCSTTTPAASCLWATLCLCDGTVAECARGPSKTLGLFPFSKTAMATQQLLTAALAQAQPRLVCLHPRPDGQTFRDEWGLIYSRPWARLEQSFSAHAFCNARLTAWQSRREEASSAASWRSSSIHRWKQGAASPSS